VVVDKFSKYNHFLQLSNPFTIAVVAQLFLTNIYKLHGMPQAIISNRDKIFTSQLWQELFRLTDVRLLMSSSYHPQTDGQTERVNQYLETFLRCFVHSCPKQWSKWLPLAEYWYNTSAHSATGHSPFQVLYGHSPRHFGIQAADSCAVPELEAWLQERAVITQAIKQHLLRTQQRMKVQAGKRRSEVTYEVGDRVFLKLQPYVQSSLTPPAHQKLSFRYFGPYTITEKIGSVAYRLALPEASSVHPVFHVSQLKKLVSPDTVVISTLPEPSLLHQVPEAILDTRVVHRGDADIAQVLVKWSNMEEGLATWENREALHQQFLGTPAWGQAGLQDPGGVSTSPALGGKHYIQVPREKRTRRPNPKFSGAQWAKG
jgi:hypothetical protein